MSLPPSALFPVSGVSYQNLNTCLYSVAGAVVADPAIGAVLPLDTGLATSGLFVQFGRDVGLQPNRKVPVGVNDPLVGALVNTSSFPVAISGLVEIGSALAFVAGARIAVRLQLTGTPPATAAEVGITELLTITTAGPLYIPFSGILMSGDSLFVQNLLVAGTNASNFTANLRGTRVNSLYGNLNSIEAPFIPA